MSVKMYLYYRSEDSKYEKKLYVTCFPSEKHALKYKIKKRIPDTNYKSYYYALNSKSSKYLILSGVELIECNKTIYYKHKLISKKHGNKSSIQKH